MRGPHRCSSHRRVLWNADRQQAAAAVEAAVAVRIRPLARVELEALIEAMKQAVDERLDERGARCGAKSCIQPGSLGLGQLH